MNKMTKNKKRQNHHPLVRWFIKITGWPIAGLYLRRKTYFENPGVQKRSLKGGVLLVSNHRSYWDYISYFALFLFRFVRPVVSYEIYHKNKLLTFFLNMIGAIVVDKNPFDFSWLEETIALLRKGKKVIIFPEAHFIQEDKLSTFHSPYITVALRAGVPILPLYTNGVYGSIHRNRVIIGEPINLKDYTDQTTLLREERERLNELVKKKIENLKLQMERQKKLHWFSPKKFFWDLGRFLVAIHLCLIYRIKFVTFDGKKRYKKSGSYLLACNHIKFNDPFVLITAFWRRRMKIMCADVVYGQPEPKKVRSFFLNQAGCIKINRETMDLKAVQNCCDSLNNGNILLIFPEGHLHKNAELGEIHEGAAMIAQRSKTDIVPSYISYGKHWYNRTRIYLGKTIPVSEKKGIKGINEMTSQLNQALIELKIKADKETKN